MLKTRIKSSQISNLTDARYFAAWGVEWLGFCFDPSSEDYLSIQAMNAIKAWIEGPKIIGEFGLQSTEEILGAIDLLALDGIQLGMHAELNQVKALQAHFMVKEVIIEKNTTFNALSQHILTFAPYVNMFLLNFDKNGISWELLQKDPNFDLEVLQAVCKAHTCILSIDFQPAAIDDLLTTLPIHGLNLKGGTEEKVGFKSYDELDDIFEALEDLEE
ncbi:MAG: N-(5'-phosphoribosyl)anthranilate isomerase [Saprospiraceae bacterium]